MRKVLLLGIVICALGFGCNNNKMPSPIMNETELEEWRQKEQPNQIAVETSFTPTVDIESIQNISLEELVIQNFYRMSYKELIEEDSSFTYEDYRKYIADYHLNEKLNESLGFEVNKLKYVSVDSNLAKAYCIQAPYQFKEHNLDYINSVCNEHREARERKEEQNAQKAWDKYLE